MPRPDSVRGYRIPPPRPTRWALAYALLYLGLPVVALLALLDLLLYGIVTLGLGRCYGLACLWQ